MIERTYTYLEARAILLAHLSHDPDAAISATRAHEITLIPRERCISSLSTMHSRLEVSRTSLAKAQKAGKGRRDQFGYYRFDPDNTDLPSKLRLGIYAIVKHRIFESAVAASTVPLVPVSPAVLTVVPIAPAFIPPEPVALVPTLPEPLPATIAATDLRTVAEDGALFVAEGVPTQMFIPTRLLGYVSAILDAAKRQVKHLS